jgi:phosphoglycolate phosphatase
MLALVVFDLDGTLVDSHHDLADATNALLSELGAAPLSDDAVTRMVGEGAAVLVKRALAAAGRDPELPGALDRFLAHYEERLLATTRPYPGMIEAIQALRPSHRLAVLTNKPGHATRRVLEGLDLLDWFDDVIGGDSEYGRKPDPSGLLVLIARAGTTPASTLMVGDSPVDLATARRAGTAICLARYGFGFRFEDDGFRGDERFADSPAEIVEVVRRYRVADE